MRHDTRGEGAKGGVAGTILQAIFGRPPDVPPRPWPALTIRELLFGLADRYDREGLASARNYRFLAKTLDEHFGHLHPGELSTEALEAYKVRRLKDGCRPSTINNELAGLRTACRWGQRVTRYNKAAGRPLPLVRAEDLPPDWCRFQRADNPRQGFLATDAFYRVHAELLRFQREDVADLCEFLFWSSWRPSDALRLRWGMVDYPARVIRLPGRDHKNRHPKLCPIVGALQAVLWRRWRKLGELGPGWPELPVFTRRGKPIRDYRRAWDNACDRAGLPGIVPYDLRRSTVRLMELSGVPRAVAMKISGHRTSSMYDRYAITSESDLCQAAMGFWLRNAPPDRTAAQG